MAAKSTACEQASPKRNQNVYVSSNSKCQCCILLRSEMCYLINELKSMMEIINIIKEETSYDRIVNGDQKTYSECVKKTHKDLFAV